MSEQKIQIGTTELSYDLGENELVLGAVLVIQTAELDHPGTTKTQLYVPDDQNFIISLGLTRYAALSADAEAVRE